MNKRAEQEWRHRSTLKKAGWDVPQRDSVAFNGGSESLSHFLCKSLAAYAMKQDGYRVASEIEGPKGTGTVDVLAYGTEDPPVAIEVETEPDDEIIRSKLDRYVRGTPLRDMLLVDVDRMPERIPDAYAFVEGEL